MDGFAERVGLPVLMQIIMESWNGVFLLLLISVMIFGIRRDRSDELLKQVNIPFTRELIVFFSAVVFYNLSDIFTLIFGGLSTPAAYYVMRAGIFVYYLTGAFLTVFFLQVIKHHIARRNKAVRLEKVLTGFQLLEIPNLILLLLTPFTNAIYSFDSTNRYIRQWGYYIWQSVTLLTFLFIIITAAVWWKKTDRFTKQIVVVASLVPTLGFVTGMIFDTSININNVTVSVSAILMFMLYEKNKTEVTLRYGFALEKAKTELAETRLRLLQSQIKPHFINNAMLAVQEVCYTDPERAAELLDHFARYLRNNINAIGSTELIPFSEEVQTIVEYLALEHADTGKKFQFSFDLRYTDFRVPALSIEPLAENAVKHGIDRYSEEGRVILSSFRTEDAYHVVIKDNGEGFDMNDETLGKGGIGLKSTEHRLKQMCGGTLEIHRSGGWTVAEIIIPAAMEDKNGNSNL